MKTRLKITLLAVVLGLAGCASTTPLQKELAAGGVPKFDGDITPITTPVLLRYKPSESRAKISVASSTSLEGRTENLHIEVIGRSKIHKTGDQLIQDSAFEKFKITENGRTTLLPAEIGGRALMDARGRVQEIDFFGIDDLIDAEGKEIETLIETLKNIPFLPKEPLQSGDTFGVEIPTAAFASADDEIAELTKLLLGGKYTVDGWGVVNGRKLMVASIDKTITKRIEGADFQVTTNGYQLWDVEAAHVVESRELTVMTVKNMPGVSVKLLTHTTQL